MSGFTPINSSHAGAVTSSANLDADSNRSSHPETTRTIASEYLGRDEDRPAAPLPKKSNTKGKKRAATVSDAPKAKRRKSSNVDDRMHVTKPRAGKEDGGPGKPAQDEQLKSSKSTKKSKPAKKTSTAVGTDNNDQASTVAKPISVYASATSMDALDSTSARTSVDSVKANAGQSFTLYQGPSSSSSFHSSVGFSQPWLSNSANTARAQSSAQTQSAENHGGDDSELVQAWDEYEMDFDFDIDNDNTSSKKSKSPKKVASPTPTAKKQKHKKTAGTSKKAATSKKDFAKSSGDESNTSNRRSTRPKKTVDYAVEKCFPDLTGEQVPQILEQAAAITAPTRPRRRQSSRTLGEDDFGEISEDDLAELIENVEAIERPKTPPPRGRKQNMREVDEHEDYGGLLLSEADRKLLEKMNRSSENTIKPIVRKPFQSGILDRSPIFGASNTTVLRTSFRLGEALNAGAQAVRTGTNMILELYARVTFSRREGRKQHFVFKDLYHDKPPYLEGTFELWDQARLWDLDSTPFLKARGQGIISRAIARMKRENQKWRLEVLSIWEASWEDVNHVAGIYMDEVNEGAYD